jgi:pyruvate/2-oxoglutarate dehydrogenase complex dihydrolipoamide dehydrogenase (E3) component
VVRLCSAPPLITAAKNGNAFALPVAVAHLQGLTEEQAVAKFGNVDVYTSSFRPMRNTISGSAMRTFMKLVVAADSDVVVGCHMVGDDSAEIMQVSRAGRQ